MRGRLLTGEKRRRVIKDCSQVHDFYRGTRKLIDQMAHIKMRYTEKIQTREKFSSLLVIAVAPSGHLIATVGCQISNR